MSPKIEHCVVKDIWYVSKINVPLLEAKLWRPNTTDDDNGKNILWLNTFELRHGMDTLSALLDLCEDNVPEWKDGQYVT